MNPAIAAQGQDPLSLAADLKKACGGNGSSAAIPASGNATQTEIATGTACSTGP